MSVVANLFHIKSTNGLFYYGLDYIRSGGDAVTRILVRGSTYNSAAQAFPNSKVVVCTNATIAFEIYRAALLGNTVFTPTPHPMPFISRQWIVIHDAYPFCVGRLSLLKKALLKLSLWTSLSRVAYINESETFPFVCSLGVSADRCRFAPNKFPPESGPLDKRGRISGNKIHIALVGTDSPKKNYESLLERVQSAGAVKLFIFHVYGHDSDYYRRLCAQFPGVDLKLFASDSFSLREFFSGVDILVSVAIQEGFGRPIASALLHGIPCFLLTRPVFEEFFNPGATFFKDEISLVDKLIYCHSAGAPRTSYHPPIHVLSAYSNAAAEIFR